MAKRIGMYITETLTADEREQYNKLDQVVVQGSKALAMALIIINESRLYREEYKTFSEYCQAKIGKGRQAVYQIMQCEQLRQSLANDPDENVSRGLQNASDKVMRALATVDENNRRAVIIDTINIANGGTITRDIVEQAKANHLRANNPDVYIADDTSIQNADPVIRELLYEVIQRYRELQNNNFIDENDVEISRALIIKDTQATLAVLNDDLKLGRGTATPMLVFMAEGESIHPDVLHERIKARGEKLRALKNKN